MVSALHLDRAYCRSIYLYKIKCLQSNFLLGLISAFDFSCRIDYFSYLIYSLDFDFVVPEGSFINELI